MPAGTQPRTGTSIRAAAHSSLNSIRPKLTCSSLSTHSGPSAPWGTCHGHALDCRRDSAGLTTCIIQLHAPKMAANGAVAAQQTKVRKGAAQHNTPGRDSQIHHACCDGIAFLEACLWVPIPAFAVQERAILLPTLCCNVLGNSQQH